MERYKVDGEEFFEKIWIGLLLVVLIILFGGIGVTQRRGNTWSAQKYAQIFSGVWQGKQEYEELDAKVDGLVFHLRLLKEHEQFSQFLDASFQYAVGYAEHGEVDARKIIFLTTRAKMQELGMQKNFSVMREFLEDARLGYVLKDSQRRAQMKAMLQGNVSASVEINSPIFVWYWVLVFGLVGQCVLGAVYFIACLVRRGMGWHRDGVWWDLPWKENVWPYLVIPFWFPGALPLVAMVGIVPVSRGIWHWFRKRKGQKDSLGERYSLTLDDYSPEGDALLQRLTTKMKGGANENRN